VLQPLELLQRGTVVCAAAPAVLPEDTGALDAHGLQLWVAAGTGGTKPGSATADMGEASVT